MKELATPRAPLLATALAATLALTLPALAQTMDHSADHSAHGASAEGPATLAYAEANAVMHSAMATPTPAMPIPISSPA